MLAASRAEAVRDAGVVLMTMLADGAAVEAAMRGPAEAVSEAIALAEALELDPHLFIDAIADGPLGSPYT